MPGVVKMDEGIKRGDEVNVVAPPNGEVVAFGISEVSNDDIRAVKHGIAVKTLVSIYEMPKVREMREYELGLFYDQSLPASGLAM